FFFSSRRRHTRFSRDWSSDVCSSDLGFPPRSLLRAPVQQAGRKGEEAGFFGFMGYDKGRRRGRDKRDRIGEDGFDPFMEGGVPEIGRASCRERVEVAVGGAAMS